MYLRLGKKPFQNIRVEFIGACPAGGHCRAVFSCLLVLCDFFVHCRLDLWSHRRPSHSKALCFPECNMSEAVVLAQFFAQNCFNRARRTHHAVHTERSFFGRFRAGLRPTDAHRVLLSFIDPRVRRKRGLQVTWDLFHNFISSEQNNARGFRLLAVGCSVRPTFWGFFNLGVFINAGRRTHF